MMALIQTTISEAITPVVHSLRDVERENGVLSERVVGLERELVTARATQPSPEVPMAAGADSAAMGAVPATMATPVAAVGVLDGPRDRRRVSDRAGGALVIVEGWLTPGWGTMALLLLLLMAWTRLNGRR